MGIRVLPPDVNESFPPLPLSKGLSEKQPRIRFGLRAIKSVGEGIVRALIDERKSANIQKPEDFVRRSNK